ncbi:hypothetical protein B0F90DRAFT_1816604 [Multifurca ochricompacta]|uniref:Uncharacterized protein n=1 Tax=Multifurca ochricompacta TaxID=376703 RepID=A0AAD4M6Q5_9AGAM|nr:hypothetical protein B0F90DRAFT_1816604 [Multifurca ochricompacta]
MKMETETILLSSLVKQNVIIIPPTTKLPPIKTLKAIPVRLLHEAIQHLKALYSPETRSSRCTIHAKGLIYNTGPNGKAMEAIRADAYEHAHAYAMRWLTAFIAQTTALRGTMPTRMPLRARKWLTDVALRNDDFGSAGTQTWGERMRAGGDDRGISGSIWIVRWVTGLPGPPPMLEDVERRILFECWSLVQERDSSAS